MDETVSPTGAPLGPYPVADEPDTECKCMKHSGSCGTCYDTVGYDTDIECPDCPIHGS